MKVLICNEPGRLDYAEREKPVPGPGEALLRVRQAGICGTDLHAFEGTQPYFSYPRILGHELAVEFVEVNGPGSWRRGDLLTVMPYFSCGHCVACRRGKPNCCAQLRVFGVHIDGGLAEYITVPATALVAAPGLGLDELALVEPFSVAAHGIRRAGDLRNAFVLVMGAGPIGLATMEMARLAGARVIALDVDPVRLAFCRQVLRVPYCLDGSTAPVGSTLAEITRGDMATVVFDATGNLGAIRDGFGYLAHGGRYVLIGLQPNDICFSHPEFHKREASLCSSRNALREDFDYVIDCIREGRIAPVSLVTHRVAFGGLPQAFPGWLRRGSGVIKALVEFS
ncbi:MAG TPA: zinc-binding alcohol dehydrogenase family protein [Chitinophagaceae bacterium]|nr:zinc-binding alcohol dehydrogenase family protein [Chitinophagaceae bacterium]